MARRRTDLTAIFADDGIWTGDNTFNGVFVIDRTATEALLVRKDSDGGDVFTVNTTSNKLLIPQSGSVIDFNGGDVTLSHSSGQLGLNGDLVITSGKKFGWAITPVAGFHLHTGTGTLGAYSDYVAIETDTSTADRGGLIISNRVDATAANSGFKITSTFNNATSSRASFGFINNDDTEVWTGGNSFADTMMEFHYGGAGDPNIDINVDVELIAGKSIISSASTSNYMTPDNGSGNALMYSRGNVFIDIDTDNSQTDRKFTITKDNAGTELMHLDETGQLSFGQTSSFRVGDASTSNVGLEIGRSENSGTTPFIDLHYGNSSSEDFNVRILNVSDGTMRLQPGTVSGSIFDNDFETTNYAGVIEYSVTASITASTTQTQGQGALTKDINEVSTVANASDTVTLPTATSGRRVTIMNNGANTLQIFPASGDNLGAGVDTATTLAAGSNIVYQSYDTTNWEVV